MSLFILKTENKIIKIRTRELLSLGGTSIDSQCILDSIQIGADNPDVMTSCLMTLLSGIEVNN